MRNIKKEQVTKIGSHPLMYLPGGRSEPVLDGGIGSWGLNRGGQCSRLKRESCQNQREERKLKN